MDDNEFKASLADSKARIEVAEASVVEAKAKYETPARRETVRTIVFVCGLLALLGLGVLAAPCEYPTWIVIAAVATLCVHELSGTIRLLVKRHRTKED
jgi:hypothetical protein